MDSSRLPRLHLEAISPTRSVVVWAMNCDETVIIGDVRLVVIERYNSWLKKDRPVGPLPLVPYVLLGDGSVVLGKKIRISGKQPMAILPVCKCGHHITQHAAHQRKRLAPTMMAYRRCGKCWCLWFRQTDNLQACWRS